MHTHSNKTAARQPNARANTNSGVRDIHVPRSVSLATSMWEQVDAEAFARCLSASAFIATAIRHLPRRARLIRKGMYKV